jgi:hypothetical protein
VIAAKITSRFPRSLPSDTTSCSAQVLAFEVQDANITSDPLVSGAGEDSDRKGVKDTLVDPVSTGMMMNMDVDHGGSRSMT